MPLQPNTAFSSLDTSVFQVANAADPTPRQIEEFRRGLTSVGSVYAGSRFDALLNAYVTHLKGRDIAVWQRAVEIDGQKKHRTSFLSEYFAYSGDSEVVPFQLSPLGGKDSPDWPLTTKKTRLHLFVFYPHKSKTDEAIPDRLKKTAYLIIRGKVPLENNPYGVVLCQGLRGYTRQEVQELVEAYQKSW